KKSFYEKLKYSAHSDGCREFYQEGEAYDNVADAYEMYVKGTQLAANGDVIDKKYIYGNVGFDWTVYHPEWKPTKKWPKAPYYEERTRKWRAMFVDFPEEDEISQGALKAYNKKHPKKEVYQLEIPYVLHKQK
ncbi:8667_t:CDS:1, partial [Paraglomus occultum]